MAEATAVGPAMVAKLVFAEGASLGGGYADMAGAVSGRACLVGQVCVEGVAVLRRLMAERPAEVATQKVAVGRLTLGQKGAARA